MCGCGTVGQSLSTPNPDARRRGQRFGFHPRHHFPCKSQRQRIDLARHRAARKSGVKGEPGGADYLYGEITESTHGRQPGTLQSLALSREKKSRAILAELGAPPESAATALEGAKAALLEHAPRSKADSLMAWELFHKAGISDSLTSTAKHALLELVSVGLIQRTGKGIKGDPYLYFAGGNDPERAKRELAEGHAIENVGRHLRGAQ